MAFFSLRDPYGQAAQHLIRVYFMRLKFRLLEQPSDGSEAIDIEILGTMDLMLHASFFRVVTLFGVALAMMVAFVRPEPAAAADVDACGAAIKEAERVSRVPPMLLTSIGIVESGRLNPATGRVAPWAWTINIEGIGHFFDSKELAIAAVRAAQAEGKLSIDVGCMQVNLLHHPNAFATLDAAFDPFSNTRYAASFLQRLFAQTGTWGAATAAYHSQIPDIGAAYREKVATVWPGSERYFAGTSIPSGRSLSPDRLPAYRTLVAEQAADHAQWMARGLLPRPSMKGLARPPETSGLQKRRSYTSITSPGAM